ncbi:helix-turn-helix domain-containing protein [Sulfobacillus harzensis]|uniref:Helix-turn-helix domain-containing protein n=1 Tax=Sulfobacillus harzensis TaxID=2729629 RepID=A0A7Y0L5N5_9FIRM|nr:helix-turn-helix domain-containing protein [Sulfobacillus harzensis]
MLGERLRDLRVRAGLSQADVAERVPISASTVSRWESGERRPDLDHLMRLTDILDCSIQDIVDAGELWETWRDEREGLIPMSRLSDASTPEVSGNALASVVMELAQAVRTQAENERRRLEKEKLQILEVESKKAEADRARAAAEKARAEAELILQQSLKASLEAAGLGVPAERGEENAEAEGTVG